MTYSDVRAAPVPAPVPACPGRRRAVLVTAVVTALLTVVALFAITWPREQVLQEWEQPPSVSYDDGSPHHVAVLDRGPHWGAATGLLGAGHRYELYAGRDPGHGYGHFLDIDLPSGSLDGATLDWTTDGIRLRLPTGHETFVPAEAFTGGR